MSPELLLIAVPGLLGVATVMAVPLGAWLGARAGYPLAVLSAACGAVLFVLLDEALDSPVTVSGQWLPTLAAEWGLRLDALGLTFALVITLVGAVVLAYSPGYLHGEMAPARYYGALTGFAAAMTLLVLAGDALVLYVGWELTTLTSYLLIAAAPGGRPAAARALLITFTGGLALLAALLLAAASLDALSLATLTDPSAWTGAPVVAFLALLVLAAAVKSVQAPFHVWLPPAMVAPTPVSAYLHAAAMVTAGLYLLLRFAGLLATQPVIAGVVAGMGAVTALFAAAVAVRRDDFKQVLAYSTISQLGFMVALVGVGTKAAIAGALAYFLAHATYKAALFLCAGVFDHSLETRKLPELAGSARRLPLNTAAVVVACVSMAGVPPALGWVGKDEGIKGLLEKPDVFQWLVLVTVVAALALTVAYSIRVAVAPFAKSSDAAGSSEELSQRPIWSMSLWAALLATVSIGLGLVTAKFIPFLHITPLIDAATEVALGQAPDKPLVVFPGFTAAFFTSVGTILAGAAVYALWRARGWWQVLPADLGTRLADGLGHRLVALGSAPQRLWSAPRPALHLGILFVVVASVAGAGLISLSEGPEAVAGESAPRWVVALLIGAGALVVARAHDRLAAFAALGAVGFLVATWYVLHGAPQLAAVQLVIDALTIGLGMFVLRHLPRTFPQRRPLRRTGAAAAALAGGLAFAGLSLFQRTDALPAASEHYLDEARSSSTQNVVTEVLSHYRALDTLGETTVIAIAAVGVVAVIRMGRQR